MALDIDTFLTYCDLFTKADVYQSEKGKNMSVDVKRRGISKFPAPQDCTFIRTWAVPTNQVEASDTFGCRLKGRAMPLRFDNHVEA